MSKVICLFLLILMSYGSQAQCPTGDIVLSTQSQIDAFAATYPGCTNMLYSITINDAVDGRSITIVNASDYSLIFAHLGSSGAGSTTLPENQILTSGGDLNIPPTMTNAT
jgi:hypothetical protein